MSDNKYVFCYWDDPVSWRNEQQTRHNNRIQNLFKKQEVADKNIQGHECGRHLNNDEEKSDSSLRMDN